MIDTILLTLVVLLLIVSLILCVKSAKRVRGRFLLITVGAGAVAGLLGSLVLNLWGRVVFTGIVAILLVLLLAILVLVGRQKPPAPPSQD
jgi:peptidoglycan/LPS O-acetylase OafA/YrhL